MKGKPLADAVAAARAFIAGKPPSDRIAVATFATRPVADRILDVDDRRRQRAADDPGRQGPGHDALRRARPVRAKLVRTSLSRRVIIVVTDGNETRSTASLDGRDRGRAATQARPSTSWRSRAQSSRPIRCRSSRRTGGDYDGAASSQALAGVYALDRRRARTHLAARVRDGGAARRDARSSLHSRQARFHVTRASASGGSARQSRASPRGCCPRSSTRRARHAADRRSSPGFIVLVGRTLALTPRRAHGLRAPPGAAHGETAEVREAQGRARAARSGRRASSARPRARSATGVSGGVSTRLLERGDLPLRTVEFVYLMLGRACSAGSSPRSRSGTMAHRLACVGGAARSPSLRLVQGQAAAQGVRGPAPGPPDHPRRGAQGRAQLQAGPADDRRRGQRARERGVPARAHRGAAWDARWTRR